ncbi:MAG: TlpA family protein disulfide reductase [Planctomycetes bacterium]|nr:TlpA family protein disulfide reductase [Planctomycetota bacterium]
MKSVKFTLLGAFVMALVFSAYSAAYAAAPQVGEKAPDFELKTNDGKTLKLSNLNGKRGAVLVFFATWCPSCMAEVPEVKKFVEESKDKNILVYGVNVRQSKEVVDKFVKDKEVNYRVLLDVDGAVAYTYGLIGIPYIVGVNGKGEITYLGHVLPKDRDKFIKDLNEGVESKKK